MGILDDAIREHLELKRKRGADSSDLERLENEAFGPVTRPGDPEFGDEAEDAAAEEPTGQSPATGFPAEAPGTADHEASGEGADRAGEEAEPAFETGEPATEGDQPAASQDWLDAIEDKLEDAPVDTGPETGEESSATPAEQARVDHADLADTIDHPAVPGPETGEQPGAEEAAAEPEPSEPPEASIFDAEEEADLELDLELDLDDDRSPADPAPAPSPEPPESDEFELELPSDAATEHPLPDADDGYEQATGEHADEAGAEDLDAGDEGDDAGDGEDLLEETPEFLKDAPEGESLWFEQAPPKDFDFDED